MNSITKKMLLMGFALLLSACAHDPQQYSYYPGNTVYSSGYTIMHRNYYGERPDHYDNGYRQHTDYFPHPHRHDQYTVKPRWGNDYQSPRHQHDRDHDHSYNSRNIRRHNDGDEDGRQDRYERRNYH